MKWNHLSAEKHLRVHERNVTSSVCLLGGASSVVPLKHITACDEVRTVCDITAQMNVLNCQKLTMMGGGAPVTTSF